jgi:hypothetical protein
MYQLKIQSSMYTCKAWIFLKNAGKTTNILQQIPKLNQKFSINWWFLFLNFHKLPLLITKKSNDSRKHYNRFAIDKILIGNFRKNIS